MSTSSGNEWLRTVACTCRNFARDNKHADFKVYCDSLPERQKAFAQEKFEHYLLILRRDRETAPIQSLAASAAQKRISFEEFKPIIAEKVPEELHDYAAKIFRHCEHVILTKRHRKQPFSVVLNKEPAISEDERFPKMKKREPYVREGVLSLDFVFGNIEKSVMILELGIKASCSSWRVKVYAEKGVTCAHCGISGTMFALERYPSQSRRACHLNLYHVATDGRETMITVDHIIPVSKGGTSHRDNLQPLCRTCNSMKGNMDEEQAKAKAAMVSRNRDLLSEVA